MRNTLFALIAIALFGCGAPDTEPVAVKEPAKTESNIETGSFEKDDAKKSVHSPVTEPKTPEGQDTPEKQNTPSKEEWTSIVGRVEAGMKVYWRDDENSKPDYIWTIKNPFIEDDDGTVYMEVVHPSGREEMLDRRAILRSDAAMAGQYVFNAAE